MDYRYRIDKIDSGIRFFLYILIFWLPYSIAVIESCVVIALILWLVKAGLLFFNGNQSRRKAPKRLLNLRMAFFPEPSFLDQPIAFFLFFCILSLVGSVYLKQSLHGFLSKILEWFIVYFLAINFLTKKKHIAISMSLFIFTSLSISFDTLIQSYITHRDIFFGSPMGPEGATAAFKHSNNLGGYLNFIVTLLFSLLFLPAAKKYHKVFLFVAFFITAWSLVLSSSRGAWLASTLGILLCLFFLHRKWMYPVGISLLALYISFYIPLLSGIERRGIKSTHATFQNVEWRVEIWQDSLKMIKERPFFGHGVNTFMRLFQHYRREPSSIILPPTYAHNCFIQLTAEVGLGGLIAFLWIFILLFKEVGSKIILEIGKITIHEKTKVQPGSFVTSRFQEGVTDSKDILLYLSVGLVAGMAAFLTQSFFDTNLYSLQLSVLFWLMTGILVAVYKLLNVQRGHGIKLAQ